MEVKAEFHNRIKVCGLCAMIGLVGAVVLYYGIFFVLALVNYFDGQYKHDTFYTLYPTAISYLVTFFTKGTLKHLPGYEIEINVGLPLLFACGMVFVGVLLFFLLRKQTLEIKENGVTGKDLLGKAFSRTAYSVRSVPFGGVVMDVNGKKHLFLCMKNKPEVLSALAHAFANIE